MSGVRAQRPKRTRRGRASAADLRSGQPDLQIGHLLRQARERAGLTQEEVAARLDTQEFAIRLIESRADDIQLATLQQYAEAIGWRLSLDWLLRPSSQLSN